MTPKKPFRTTELVFILAALVGMIVYWIQVDTKGYLLYTSLILGTLFSVFYQLKEKKQSLKYSKWLLLIFAALIVIAGIDRMTTQELSSSAFVIIYIIFVFIQPKPLWITRP